MRENANLSKTIMQMAAKNLISCISLTINNRIQPTYKNTYFERTEGQVQCALLSPITRPNTFYH